MSTLPTDEVYRKLSPDIAKAMDEDEKEQATAAETGQEKKEDEQDTAPSSFPAPSSTEQGEGEDEEEQRKTAGRPGRPGARHISMYCSASEAWLLRATLQLLRDIKPSKKSIKIADIVETAKQLQVKEQERKANRKPRQKPKKKQALKVADDLMMR